MSRPPPPPTLFPYTTLFRSTEAVPGAAVPAQHLHGADTDAGATRPPPRGCQGLGPGHRLRGRRAEPGAAERRSEEHTSELQSRFDLVCRLLLEKKKNIHTDF